MILITGDTHIPHDIRKLNNDCVKASCDGIFPNYVIVTGDFGLLWSNNSNDKEELYWTKWLNEKPYKVLFLDGNHENFTRLNALPKIEMFGSKVGKVSDNIFHLKRGNIYTIENNTYFVMGGAESTDKESRQTYISWWHEEVSSHKEFYYAMENLKNVKYCVDYVLTHTAPKDVLNKYFNSERYNDPTAIMLQQIYNVITFKHWYFGHMHEDKKLNDEFTVCYNKHYII